MVKKILGIHDGGDGWPLIHASLKASGFEVGVTDDLRMSLEMAVLCHPDLILLDLDLSDLAGWKLLQQLKTNPSTAAIPVVGLSEYPISLRDQACGEGCVACEFKLEAPPHSAGSPASLVVFKSRRSRKKSRQSRSGGSPSRDPGI